MKHLLLVGIFLVVAVAGCLDNQAQPANDETSAAPVATDPNAPNVTFGPHSGLPRTLAEAGPRDLNNPPNWVLGEWWTIRLTSYFDGKVTEVTRIVSGKEDADYLVGMPRDAFDNEAMVLHVPGFGLVDHETHGFEAHDVFFQALQFPLKPGESWVADFQAPNQLTAIVDDVADGTATISMSGQYGISMVYDAAMGAITLMDIANYGKYEVIAHGFDYEGMVTVPYKHDLIFFNGRLAGVGDLSKPLIPPTPAPPTETVIIPDDYDRVSFTLILGDMLTRGFTASSPVGGAPADPGYYDIDVVAPDETLYEGTKTPADGPGVLLSSFSHDKPAGNWDITSIAAGPGVAFIEGIAYIVYDVALPDGCVVLTNRIHNHGGECGGHVHGLE